MPTIPPGEGERRAATGYRPQYRVAAELTIAHIRDVDWVKVADPAAGTADDFQLATRAGHLHALQVKWSAFPAAFTFARLVQGNPPLVAGLADAWKRLRVMNPGRVVHIHLVTNDYPSTSDAVVDRDVSRPTHFGAFVARSFIPVREALRRGHNPDDESTLPTIDDWQDAWRRLRVASGLDRNAFWRFVSDVDMHFGVGAEVFPEFGRSAISRARDVRDLADFFFAIVADPAHIVKLTRSELLERLGWMGRLSFRNSHVFPVPSAYRPNVEALASLLEAVETHPGGYLAVVAPAGAGKSSLLTATTLPADRVVHYYAFTPAAPDPSTGRGESENFFYDIVTALDTAGIHTPDVVDPRDRLGNKERLLRQLEAAGAEWAEQGRRTVIVVDGLDHIPREQRPARSLIDDLPDPSQIPDGVLVVLGTQLLDILPIAVRKSLSEESRTIGVPPLSDETILAVAEAAGPGRWLRPDQKQRLVAATEGHPLALAYLLEQLAELELLEGDAADSETWKLADAVLTNSTAFGGDVQKRYEGYWQQVATAYDLRHLLGITSRLRSPIDLEWLRSWNDPEVVARFADITAPFFVKDGPLWSFIHNSFRLFLKERTASVAGAYDAGENRRLHAEAAAVCAVSEDRWPSYRDEELGQRVQAEEHDVVLSLATPERLRQRLLNLAPPAAVRLDAGLALRSAAALGDRHAVIRLGIFLFELDVRTAVLEPHELALALVEVGEYEKALDHVVAGRELRIGVEPALRSAAALVDAGRLGDAGLILRAAGSLRALLQTVGRDRFYDRQTEDVIIRWVAVHARIRPLVDVLSDIDDVLPAPTGDSHAEQSEIMSDEQDEDPVVHYRHAALVELATAARAFTEEERRFVIDKLAPLDRADAAYFELFPPPRTPSAARACVEAALKRLGIEVDDKKSWRGANLAAMPASLRIVAAEVLSQYSELATIARSLTADCNLEITYAGGEAEEQELWLLYRLLTLRHLLGLPSRPYEGLTSSESSDSALRLFWNALNDLAEMDASVRRFRLDPSRGIGPVMPVVRRLIRFYEVPTRQRRAWNRWYIIAGSAQRFYQTLISVAMEADHANLSELWDLFLGAWRDPARAEYWPHRTRAQVLRSLANAGAGREAVLVELRDLRQQIEVAELEAYDRMRAMLSLARAFDTMSATDDATSVLRATVRASLVAGAHEHDRQLYDWVLCCGEFVRSEGKDLPPRRRVLTAMAERLNVARISKAPTEEAAKELLRLTFAVDPGLAVDVGRYFEDQGVADGPGVLGGLLAGAASDVTTPAYLGADVLRSIYMPAAVVPLGDTAASLLERGGKETRAVLLDGVRRWVLPSQREHWADLGMEAAAPAPRYIGELRDHASKSTDSEAAGAEDTLNMVDGTTKTAEEAAQAVSSPAELLDLVRGSVGGEYSRKAPLGRAVGKVAAQLAATDVEPLLGEFERVRADAASYAVVASEFAARGQRPVAELVVVAALRNISMHGWSTWWDGGTRRQFWAQLVDSDPTFIGDAVEDLATALRVDAFQLSGFVHDLPYVLAVVELNMADVWPDIDSYLDTLCPCPEARPALELRERRETGTKALLRHVAGFAGHPVRELEWGARAVLRRALTNSRTARDAAIAVVEGCTDGDAAAEALLGAVVAAVDVVHDDAVHVLADTVAQSGQSEDQIVRDVGRGAAAVLGIEQMSNPRQPLPLTYSLAVPRLPSHAIPAVDDEGIAVLDPTNPRSRLGTYDSLLEKVAPRADIDPNVLIYRAAQWAEHRAEEDRWTAGGPQAHAARLKHSGWLHAYRPWALMAGRRGAATAIAHLVDARRLPEPGSLTVSERLELVDDGLDDVEPEALPLDVRRPARRDRWGGESGTWCDDTSEAARIYDASWNGSPIVLAEWADWTEFSWARARERRVSVIRKSEPDEFGALPITAEERLGALREVERFIDLGAFRSAGRYRAYAGWAEGNADGTSPVVGAQEWWAESRTGEWLALDPEVGVALGWKLSRDGLFEWRDSGGGRMAWSRWWVQCLDSHQPPHFNDDGGQGWQVLLSEEGWAAFAQAFEPLTRWMAVARAAKRSHEWEKEVLTVVSLSP